MQLPLVRTLLALGAQAQVRFYQNLPMEDFPQGDVVNQIFAVTYPDAGAKTDGKAGGKTTFFVLVRMQAVPACPARKATGGTWATPAGASWKPAAACGRRNKAPRNKEVAASWPGAARPERAWWFGKPSRGTRHALSGRATPLTNLFLREP